LYFQYILVPDSDSTASASIGIIIAVVLLLLIIILAIIFGICMYKKKKEEEKRRKLEEERALQWRSVLLVEETGVAGENHRPVVNH
jgi:flagellar basal body-associated protein FliL